MTYYNIVIFKNLKGFENHTKHKELSTLEYWKNIFLKHQKVWKIENSEISEISEVLFQVFPCPSFQFSDFGLPRE